MSYENDGSCQISYWIQILKKEEDMKLLWHLAKEETVIEVWLACEIFSAAIMDS